MKEFGTAIILAGGKSSRMGFDKHFLVIDEKRLIESMIDKLKDSFDDFVIVTNKPEYYVDFPAKIVGDQFLGKGPLGGIHAGLSSGESKYCYVIACDMPNINIDYIEYMKTSIRGTDYEGCITKSLEWIEPFNSFYSKDLVEALENNLSQEGKGMIYPFLKSRKICYIEENIARNYTPDWNIFINLNTKEELDSYLDNI